MADVDDWEQSLRAASEQRASGDLEGADTAYQACIARAGDEPGDVARATLALSSVRYHRGMLTDAEELATQVRSLAAAAGLTRYEGRAANLIGILAMQRQDWEGARGHFERALECAYEIRDDELVGAVCMNLGAVLNIRGDLREARSYYLESIGSGVRSTDRRQLVMAYNNLGMVCSDLEEWMEALVYFGRGIEIAGDRGGDPLLATLHVNQAEPLIETSEMERARESLDTAEAHANRINDQSVTADVARLRGRIARLRGDLGEAGRHLGLALELARGDRFALNRAETLEEQGRLFAQQGDAEAALQRLTMARTEFSTIGALRDTQRVDAEIARLISAIPTSH